MNTPRGDSAKLMTGAMEYCRLRQCEQAIALLETAAQTEPANSAVQYQLGLCYSGSCQPHSLVDNEIGHVHLSKALSLLRDDADPLQKARILAALGNTYAALRHMPAKARLMAAIDCHQRAAPIFRSAARLDDWAREEFNLGNAFSELPQESGVDKWREAMRHYEAGLQTRTREKDAEGYAGTLQNLGIAYRELTTGNRSENIKRSILCYRRALRVRRRSSHPRGYVALQINTGNSFLSLARVEKANTLRHGWRALRHYERAMKIAQNQHFDREYATALFNRGEALVCIARESGAEIYLREAGSCFRTAAGYFRRLENLDLFRKSNEWLDKISIHLDALHTKT